MANICYKYGQKSTFITSNLTWPNQQDPGPKAWSTWRRALKRTMEHQHSLLPIYQPNQWKSTNQRHIHWFYNHSLDKLIRRANNNKWHYYAKATYRGRRRRHPIYFFRGALNSLPPHSTSASITHMSLNTVKFTGTLQLMPQPTNPPRPNNIQSFIAAIPLQQQSHI